MKTIDEMTDLELDVELAGKVMGWTRGVQPFYSTDPAASRELKKAMEAKGWEWSIDSPCRTHSRYCCMFVKVNSDPVYGYGDSPERAIALASLKALS